MIAVASGQLCCARSCQASEAVTISANTLHSPANRPRRPIKFGAVRGLLVLGLVQFQVATAHRPRLSEPTPWKATSEPFVPPPPLDSCLTHIVVKFGLQGLALDGLL